MKKLIIAIICIIVASIVIAGILLLPSTPEKSKFEQRISYLENMENVTVTRSKRFLGDWMLDFHDVDFYSCSWIGFLRRIRLHITEAQSIEFMEIDVCATANEVLFIISFTGENWKQAGSACIYYCDCRS